MKFRILLLAIGLMLWGGQNAYSQFPARCIDVLVTVEGGGDQVVACEGDGLDETINFSATSLAMPVSFLITDENNIIIRVSVRGMLSFEGLGGGTFRVYAFSWLGQITARRGQDATTAGLGSFCGNLSDNFITVTNFTPDGGAIATAAGNTSETVCVGDGVPDVVTFTTTAAVTQSYAYLITDENNIVLAVATGNSFDFDGLGAGISRVWGISYAGTLTASPGDVVGVDPLAGDCFGLSENFIEIIRSQPDGGTVELTNGETSATVCVGDGQDDILSFTNLTSSPAAYTFVITDDNNIILDIPDGNSANFEGTGAGTGRIWGLSYTGNLIAQVGDDAAAVALSDDCFELSGNFIEVIRQEADGGMVSLADGSTDAVACVGDGTPDEFSFINTSVGADNYTYLITDEDNIILAIDDDGTFDFEGADVGTCRVWGLAYGGTLLAEVGDDAASAILADGCFGLSDNFITIRRESVDGGTVTMPNGETIRYTCPGDGNPDIVRFDSTGSGTGSYAYVITDENNIILDLPAGDSADFDGAPAGTCRVWGLAYTGNITAQVGDDAAAVALSDDCFDLSDNFITVVRETPDGGTVAMPNGETIRYTCPGDGMADIVMFDSTGTTSGPYAYVITDENNIILDLPAGDSADFDGAPAGTCRVWGLAYTGNITAQVGDDAAAVALSDDCFDLSDNFITVIREAPDGGSVALADGTNLAFTCPGDGNPDILLFDSTGTAGPSYTYVITDELNIILDLPGGDSFDFDGAPAGICRVWGLAFTGNLTAQVGDDAAAVALSDDCFDLSDNFIAVVRQQPEAGTVQMPNGETIRYTCPGDGNPDIVLFDSLGAGITPYAYVVTDEDNNILAFPTGDSFDFDGAPAGTCRVWGLAYTGNVTAQVGDDAAAVALSDDCFDLSDNFITVIRETPEGGTVATEDGENEVAICPGDGNPDIIRFDSSGTAGQYVYVVTDEDNIILALPGGDSVDFDLAGIGIARVWGLAYTGTVTAQLGDDAADVLLSDDCFDLSDNFITVIRETPEGGTVAMPNGETIRYTCPGDGNPDVVMFDSTGTSGLYTYVITDEDNNILALPAGDSFDFDSAPPGTCRVWGLAYSGNLTAAVGDNAAAVALSDDCFDLSDNFITVIREVPEGGTVAMPNGETIRYTCPGDGNPDVVMFDSAGTAGQYIYVITDDENEILALPAGDSFDFEDAPAGECRVWGLAYSGNLLAEVSDNLDINTLSDDCFDLSDNFITIIRQAPDAGEIGTEAGPVNLDICVGDGIADSVTFIVDGASDNPFIFVVTDENDFIISALDDATFDFDQALPGIYRIYGLSYTGQPSLVPGDNIFLVDLSTDCFDLTSNFVEINAIGVDGATIFTSLGVGQDLINLCVGDGVADNLEFFTTTSATSADYAFAITNENDVVIGFLPPDNTFNFELAGMGIAKVWGISYTGNLTLNVGQVITETTPADGCFAFSQNVITIVRDFPEGGQVATNDGESDILVCLGPSDGVVDFITTSTTINAYVYLLTDGNNIVLDVYTDSQIDFALLPIGNYRVWGLSYTGTLNSLIGQDAAAIDLATSCFELSANFVSVSRGPEVDGGVVSTAAGLDTIYQCPMDGVADIVEMQTSSQDLVYRYIITDEDGRVIVGEVINPVIDFEGAGVGVYHVWGVSVTGPVTIGFNDDLMTTPVSDSCYELSENFITIVREAPDGGSVFTSDTADAVSVVVGDSIPDEVSFISVGASNSNFVFVLTDEDNVILDVFSGDTYDFEGAAPGVCRVWGLAYTGNLIAMPGDTASIVMLTDDCWSLSDNFVTVTRTDGPSPSERTAGILSLQLAPNPAVDYAVVRFTLGPDAEAVSTLRILDGNGRMVQAERVASTPGENRYELQISGWSGGLYVVSLINGTEVIAERLIVARP
ncbi:MAG: T9SS type A sorting domain-containing protein [Lewinellaceae bacterium]|nr:T9SS type A sorting domain-containing protein [Lewinellaceae bacterium]